jgi:energy-coupling factor transporter ATP-binding protein EcfA2
MTTAVEFRDFGFTYAGATEPSLTGVNLDLPAGRLVSVVAPQGTGKTTLLRAAAGLFEHGDTGGEIRGILARSEGQLAGAFFDGYVQVTLAVETVREEIALPLYAGTGFPNERAGRVESVARELRIEHLLDREVTALSGGEEKLVGIAAALVVESYLYVLDEPFEQLDVAHYSSVIRAARRRARAGALVLIGTGSVDTALNISDAIVAFDGTTWRYVDAPTYADVAGIRGLTASSLGQFLGRRGLSLAGVRRFRDGVRRAS